VQQARYLAPNHTPVPPSSLPKQGEVGVNSP
jgi:hypothetical protein